MIEINLIPEELRKKSGALAGLQLGLPREVVVGIVSTCILLMLIAHGSLAGFWYYKGTQLAERKGQWQAILPDKSNIDNMGKELKELKGRMAGIVDVVSSKDTSWSRKLNIISDSMTQGLWLRKIMIDKTALVIEGSILFKNKNEIGQIGAVVAYLKKDAFFMRDISGIEVNSIQKGKRGTVEVSNFVISAKFK